MSKPKNMTPEQEDAWKAKRREYQAKYYAKPEAKAKRREYDAKPEAKAKKREYDAKPEVKAKKREYMVEYNAETRNQSAADQFFIMAGAVESLTNLITQTKKTA